MSVGCGLYIAASLGAGPRDTVMMIIASKGYSVKTGRMVMEVFAAIAGWLLGGPVGIGTRLRKKVWYAGEEFECFWKWKADAWNDLFSDRRGLYERLAEPRKKEDK